MTLCRMQNSELTPALVARAKEVLASDAPLGSTVALGGGVFAMVELHRAGQKRAVSLLRECRAGETEARPVLDPPARAGSTEPASSGNTGAAIESLHPSARVLAMALVERARVAGVPLVVTSGFRSEAEQERLFAQGRTAPGPIVTHAQPGQSWHNHGLAFDVAPLDVNNQPHWPPDVRLWMWLGELGESLGLKWGGRFPAGQQDLPHFEYHPGVTLADASAGARPAVPPLPPLPPERAAPPARTARAGGATLPLALGFALLRWLS